MAPDPTDANTVSGQGRVHASSAKTLRNLGIRIMRTRGVKGRGKRK